jgi:hypothetical protein
MDKDDASYWERLNNSGRLQSITPDEFRRMLEAKQIRGASLEDVLGTHHKRALYRHPNTQQYFVAVN